MQTVQNAVSVHARINKSLLRKLDIMAASRDTSRSELVDTALRTFITSGFKASSKVVRRGRPAGSKNKVKAMAKRTTSSTKARTRSK